MDDVIKNFYLNGGCMRGLAERLEQENSGKTLRDTVGDYTIDSCHTFDEGYETAMWKGKGDMVIVERYPTFDEMEEGHKKWCEFCKNNPTEAYSVQLDETIKFEEREYE